MDDICESMIAELETKQATKCDAQNMSSTATQGPMPLWNRKAPQYVRQQEQAWHRIALEMGAKGYTAVEIAASLGCSPTAAQDILRQPQYQQTQVDLIRRDMDSDRRVVEIIKEEVVNAVQTLAEIVNSETAKNADRIAAARELLNRRYGMPNQPINRQSDVDLNALSDNDLKEMLPTTLGTASTQGGQPR